jgi:hypothetical protein
MSPVELRDHVGRRYHTLQHAALHRRTIRMICRNCGRVVRWQAVGLWWLFRSKRWDDRISEVPRRVRCSICPKGSGPILVDVTDEKAEPDRLPYPDEREWKRITSRYRA